MPSLLDSPPQIPAAGAGASAWDSLYAVQEPVKPRHLTAVVPGTAAAVAKKPATYYGSRKKNLETCTEALGCETGAVDKGDDGEVEEEIECAERKRRAREEEMEMEGRASRHQSSRRPLPPPLRTLARGASRVRLVHERRDGRLAVYAVRAHGVEAERSGGRFRMRLISSLPSGGRQESPEAEAKEEVVVEDGECGVAKFVRGGRCVEAPEGAVGAVRRGKQWEPEQMQTAAFWVATSS